MHAAAKRFVNAAGAPAMPAGNARLPGGPSAWHRATGAATWGIGCAVGSPAPAARRQSWPVVWGLVLALLALVAPASLPPLAVAKSVALATVAVDTPLLVGPDEDAGVEAGLSEGDEVELTGRTAVGFLEVERRGERGWVAASDLALSDRVGIPLAEAAAGAAIRAAPMPDAEVLGSVPAGGVVLLTGANVGAFVAGSFDGVGGWIAEADLALPMDRDGSGY